MPMIWDENATAKLMTAIFTVTETKLTGAQMQRVAEIMGPGCTAKAISHRLTAMRKKAAGLLPGVDVDGGEGRGAANGGAGGASRNTSTATMTTATAATTNKDLEKMKMKTKTTAVGKGKGKNARSEMRGGDDDDDDDDDHYDDDLRKGKKIKVERAESEGEEDGIEVGEDIGEGFRRVSGEMV